MAFDDSICDCGADNLTDYPVCPRCATRLHFTHRADCRCASCARPAIVIRPSRRNTWDFAPPFRNDRFLEDFQTQIGKPFRFWNTRTSEWEIRPLDEGMLTLIEQLLAKHFPAYRVVRVQPAEQASEPVAA